VYSHGSGLTRTVWQMGLRTIIAPLGCRCFTTHTSGVPVISRTKRSWVYLFDVEKNIFLVTKITIGATYIII